MRKVLVTTVATMSLLSFGAATAHCSPLNQKVGKKYTISQLSKIVQSGSYSSLAPKGSMSYCNTILAALNNNNTFVTATTGGSGNNTYNEVLSNSCTPKNSTEPMSIDMQTQFADASRILQQAYDGCASYVTQQNILMTSGANKPVNSFSSAAPGAMLKTQQQQQRAYPQIKAGPQPITSPQVITTPSRSNAQPYPNNNPTTKPANSGSRGYLF